MFMLIKEATIKFPDHKLHGIYVSPEAQDLINKLLDKNMETRLGSDGGVDQIMAHDFFKGLDIQKLLNKEIKAPFKPVIDSLTSNFDESVTGMDPRESSRPSQLSGPPEEGCRAPDRRNRDPWSAGP